MMEKGVTVNLFLHKKVEFDVDDLFMLTLQTIKISECLFSTDRVKQVDSLDVIVIGCEHKSSNFYNFKLLVVRTYFSNNSEMK